VFNVNTFLANGSVYPEIIQTLAIYIIASFSAVGKVPRSDKHSMSNDITLSGAIFENSPSHFLW
jgi:hypothetical protein